MNFLESILASTQLRVAQLGKTTTRDKLEAAALAAPPTRGFARALRAPGLSVIAEIKRASPSKGSLRDNLEPAALAHDYESAGAAAISVLTEPEWFKGSEDDLVRARAACAVPVLYKDFIVSDEQILQARAIGADAVLLIARVSTTELKAQIALCDAIGIDALVECFDATDITMSTDAGAKIIGINQRNLVDFEEDPTAAVALRGCIPKGVVSVAESAVRTAVDMELLSADNFDAALIGETLLRALEPGKKLRDLLWRQAR